jgi:hypothetical protein
MRTLSVPHAAALSAAVQRPALLVQIDFATVRRWTSHAALTWGGHSWAAMGLRVDDLVVDALRVSGTLVLDNSDDVAGTLVLGEGINDRPITIYGYDAAATGAADVVWLATAVGASAQVSASEVRIDLRHKTEFTVSPRTYADVANGFTHLLGVGSWVRINGIAYQLDRKG